VQEEENKCFVIRGISSSKGIKRDRRKKTTISLSNKNKNAASVYCLPSDTTCTTVHERKKKENASMNELCCMRSREKKKKKKRRRRQCIM
jgi:hypothetical protein